MKMSENSHNNNSFTRYAAVILFAAILLTMFPVPLQKIKIWMNNKSAATTTTDDQSGAEEYGLFYGEVIPCTQISVRQVWSNVHSQLNSESPVRRCDVNGDSIDDIIIGYGVGKLMVKLKKICRKLIFFLSDDSFQFDDRNVPKCPTSTVAAAADGQPRMCEGGIIALNGQTGTTIWQTWTEFNVFSMFCSRDMNADGRKDCVAAGRGGVCLFKKNSCYFGK